MSLHLRSVNRDDDAFLFDLYATTREAELDAWGWNAAERDSFLTLQFGAQSRAYECKFPAADHHIILERDVPIGRIIVHRGEEEIRLVDVTLLPAHQGAGIGTDLIRGLLEEADGARKPLRLHVLKGNSAVRLYERMGFVAIGDSDPYVEMEKRPPPMKDR